MFVFTVLALLPGRTQIPPLVESDYAYQLLAADRLYAGLGLTSLQPVAPRQPWDWHYDWGFLTQWPAGYPLLVCLMRCLFGFSTVAACQWISVGACALALAGWFVWVKRTVPRGVAGTLLAAVAAGCSVSVSLLINPSTDGLLIAALPFVLLSANRALEHSENESGAASRRLAAFWLAAAGLMSGGLFWIRYAGIFVPMGIGAYLLVEPGRHRRRIGLRRIAVFGLGAAGPIAALLLINQMLGTGSTQARLNMGHTIGFDPSPGMLATAWWNFTDLGFYSYRWFSHWVCALWPAGLVVVAACAPRLRKTVQAFLAAPTTGLSVSVVVALLVMLVGVTALFGGKFNFAALERYYQPVKPLYFVLFVAPLLLIPARVVRVGTCAVLLVACSWLVQQEWRRPYDRWRAAQRQATPYGQWARCFNPGTSDLYGWLRAQATLNLIIVSNFHEYVALETGIPALPIPPDRAALDRWIERIRPARGITEPCVWFILDSHNKWRDYWIAKPADVISDFDLGPHEAAPANVAGFVFEYDWPCRSLWKRGGRGTQPLTRRHGDEVSVREGHHAGHQPVPAPRLARPRP